MRNHDTSQHLHANLADTNKRDYHLEQPLHEICSKENQIKYLKSYQMYLALQITF